jgi:hypothetical protein
MSKDTTDELRGRLFEILDNNRLVVTETLAENAIDGIITLISNREKLAMIDALEKTMPHTDGMRHYNTVKSRIATLRKELDGGSDE